MEVKEEKNPGSDGDTTTRSHDTGPCRPHKDFDVYWEATGNFQTEEDMTSLQFQ